LDYYRYFTVLLQELSIELEGNLLSALNDLIDFRNLSQPSETGKGYDDSVDIQFPSTLDGAEKLYFEQFLLQPIQINLSYNQSETLQERTYSSRRKQGILNLANDVLTKTVGNIHNAPIKMNALSLSHPIFPKDQIWNLLWKFYSEEFYGQLHRIVGSADFLGNPVGLFNNVASGVKDMFYEPLHGFEITKPDEFGIGVAKGASSLMKKTVFGLSESFSKFTGSVGKGLSVLTLDSKFQKSRQIAGR
jgi:vacuolar protein sorting-associated protein 13A/C